MTSRHAPGEIRDAIIEFLKARKSEANLSEIREGVIEKLGEVPDSSIRSYLRLNTPQIFTRMGRGKYKLASKK